MPLEQVQEALPDGPRRPENADPDLLHRCSLTHRMPAASIEHTYNRSARGDLPRIAATLNKVLKGDRPRRGTARAFLFPERASDASERNRAGGRLDVQPGRRVRLRRGSRRALAPRHRPGGACRARKAGCDRARRHAPRPRYGAGGRPAVSRFRGRVPARPAGAARRPHADGRVRHSGRPGPWLFGGRDSGGGGGRGGGAGGAARRPPPRPPRARALTPPPPPAALPLPADSDIPVAGGFGSWAAATVAGAAAGVGLLGLKLDAPALAELASELEGHPDNVAPAVFGGANLVLREPDGLVVTPLPMHPSLALVFAVPEFTVETKRARAALPATLPHADAARAAAKSAALVHGLAHADLRLLAAGLDDVLHVPFRRALAPGNDEVTSAPRPAGPPTAPPPRPGPPRPARARARPRAPAGP